MRNIINIARKPAWALSVARAGADFGQSRGHVSGMENVNFAGHLDPSPIDPALSWKDVEWIRTSAGSSSSRRA